MVRLFSFMTLTLFILAVPVMAQENADEVLAEQSGLQEGSPVQPVGQADDYEARLKLARQMHEIWPVRPKVEGALESISYKVPKLERLKFKAAMRAAIQFEALEQASAEAMADIFTAKELEAMIAFYGSKEGRSVSHKTSDYENALKPALIKMIDKALLDVKLGAQ